MLRRTGSMAVLLAIFALFVFQVSPAFAHHKDAHKGGGSVQQADHEASSQGSRDGDGDADSDSSTAYTEDNDTNDGGTPNNVADEGDNRHPSGKDKSVENGGSGTQGKSESNPDDSKGPMRYEGELGDDKANGPGGTDLADQDGNNGCGNDDDFDDDNNGWCGKPTDTDTDVEGEVVVCVDVDSMPDGKVCDEGSDSDVDVDIDDDDVLGTDDDNAESDEDDVLGTDAETDEDDVLGTLIHRAVVAGGPSTVAAAVEAAAPGGVLPFTGASLVPLAIAGLSMIGTGAALARRKR